MGHQPFENWLLSEEPLTPDQVQVLQAHMKTCGVCRQLSVDWAAVKQLFGSAAALTPAPGFSTRWLARQALENVHEKRRKHLGQSIRFFLINAVSAVTLFILIAFQLYRSFDTPLDVFLVGVDQFKSILHFFKAIQEILLAVFRVMASLIPSEGWIFMVVLVGLMSLAWIATLRRLMIPRRITL